MAKKTKLINANFRSASVKLGSEALTTVHFSAPFNPDVAEQLGVKDRVYKRKADEDEPDMRGYDVGIDWYGPMVTIRARQGTLDGKAKISGDGTSFRVLRLYKMTIKRHADDEQMLLSFQVILIDENSVMNELIRTIKKEGMDIDITPAAKKAAADASNQLRLISKEQADDTSEAADEG